MSLGNARLACGNGLAQRCYGIELQSAGQSSSRMDAAIAAVLRQAAAAIGEPERAAQVLRVASEARAGDLAYLSGDDSDDSEDDGWEYAACPDAEQRFEAVEVALANRYAS